MSQEHRATAGCRKRPPPPPRAGPGITALLKSQFQAAPRQRPALAGAAGAKGAPGKLGRVTCCALKCAQPC